MAYTSNPYCTLDQVVAALDLSSSAQIEDRDWISTDLIPQAQAAIDRYLGFMFQSDGTTQSPTTRLLSGKDSSLLWIRERCISFSEVLEDSTDITSDCVLGPDSDPGAYLVRLSGDCFEKGVQNYQITGVFGRESIPYEITRCCIRTAVAWYKMRDTNYNDYIIEGMVRQHYQRTLPDDVVQILNTYKPKVFRA